jgi:hypothetical protein
MTRIALPNPRRAVTMVAACTAFLLAGAAVALQADIAKHAAAAAYGKPVDSRLSSLELEARFWQCDYAATTYGVSLAEGAQCVEVFEELKRRKFGGDFQALLVWWQESKSYQHGALAAERRAAMVP